MSRKFYFLFVLVGVFLLIGQLTSFAQTAPVNGTVVLVKADGTREPVAGALIEVYRIDIKSGFPSAKTNKKGEFSFAGLPLVGAFAFAVSAPNCAPTIFPNVRAGQENLVIIINPGDGSKLSEDDVRKGATAKTPAAKATTEITADQKKQQAEFEKKNAEITAKNEKMKNGDEIARKANDEGNAAIKAGNYDLAITRFSDGVAAVPDFVGSTPILLNGKIIALKSKGFKIYKEGASLTDIEARKAKYEEANKSYDEALSAFQDALTVIKNAEASTDPAEQKRRSLLKSDLYAAATEIHRLKAVSGVDTSKVADANTVITEYVALETDPVKKLAAQITLGDIMRLTGDLDKAVAAYRLVLETKPDQPEAMASLGLSLFAQGAGSTPEDKAKEQEGLNLMQKYTEIAPVTATDPQSVKELKLSVKDAVEYLKAQKMAPQKLPSSGKKKP